METDKLEVAKTILAQLGGNVFARFTGAHTFIGSEQDRSLTFKFPAKPGYVKDGINFVTIKLRNDLYEVTLARRLGLDVKTIYKTEGIYCDQLAEILQERTGLYWPARQSHEHLGGWDNRR